MLILEFLIHMVGFVHAPRTQALDLDSFGSIVECVQMSISIQCHGGIHSRSNDSLSSRSKALHHRVINLQMIHLSSKSSLVGKKIKNMHTKLLREIFMSFKSTLTNPPKEGLYASFPSTILVLSSSMDDLHKDLDQTSSTSTI